jgi:hypothetical protein
MAFDATDNLFVADLLTNTVQKVTPAGLRPTFATGFNQPVGVAFSPSAVVPELDPRSAAASVAAIAGLLAVMERRRLVRSPA